MDRLEDNKFAHLLQPIRDLVANWDINIANELEDYLVWSLPFIQGTKNCGCQGMFYHVGERTVHETFQVNAFRPPGMAVFQ